MYYSRTSWTAFKFFSTFSSKIICTEFLFLGNDDHVWGNNISNHNLRFFFPIWGAKIYKASKNGMWGSLIGMLIGLVFFPPFGMILGLLIGAIIGELFAGKNSRQAFKIGLVTFAASLVMIIAKLITSGIMSFYLMLQLF